MPDKDKDKSQSTPKPKPLSDDQLDKVAGGKGADEEGQKK